MNAWSTFPFFPDKVVQGEQRIKRKKKKVKIQKQESLLLFFSFGHTQEGLENDNEVCKLEITRGQMGTGEGVISRGHGHGRMVHQSHK